VLLRRRAWRCDREFGAGRYLSAPAITPSLMTPLIAARTKTD
jgi:hypothetical protein